MKKEKMSALESKLESEQQAVVEADSSLPDKTPKKIERVVISDESVSRINAWIKQIESSRPGVEISRRDLVEWLILHHAPDLSPSEVKELSDSHYNELRFLQYAVRELKAAKERGEKVALQDVIGTLPVLSRPKERAVRSKKPRVSEGIGVATDSSSESGAAPQPNNSSEGGF